MGSLIAVTASIDRIEDHVRRTLRTALPRGGEIGQLADRRLTAAVANIDVSFGVHKAAAEAEATAWAAVLAEDDKSDTCILMTRDTMWNLLGRARQSADMDQVFPSGVRLYTAADPQRQPMLMHILQSRIRSATASRWSEELRTQWIADLETCRVAYQAALAARQPLEAAAIVALAGYHTAVRAAHARLRTYKKDLQVLGLSEAQIHEIIPDASIGASHAAPPPASTNAGGAAA